MMKSALKTFSEKHRRGSNKISSYLTIPFGGILFPRIFK